MAINALSTLASSAAEAEFDTVRLVSVFVLSIFLILVLILVFRIQAFVSLLLAAIFVGIASGTMSLTDVGATIEKGMGSSLGFIATIIGPIFRCSRRGSTSGIITTGILVCDFCQLVAGCSKRLERTL